MDVTLGDNETNLRRMEAAFEQTRRAGALLTVFPECALTGYCFESLAEARPYGEPLPGPSVQRLTAAARRWGGFAAYGLLESDGDRLFNACALVGADGLVGGYRKVHLPYLGVDRFTTPGDRGFAVHAEEDAAAIRALDQGDADALARTVDRLPRLLAALEGEASCSPSARKHPARVRPRGVRIRVADTLYEATGFAAHQIVARGDVPLPEELLLEVELVSDPPTRFHARVLLCWPEDGRFGVVLVPLALTGPALLHWPLTGPALLHWQGLVARATAS